MEKDKTITSSMVKTFFIAGSAMLGVIGVAVLVNWIDNKRLDNEQPEG